MSNPLLDDLIEDEDGPNPLLDSMAGLMGGGGAGAGAGAGAGLHKKPGHQGFSNPIKAASGKTINASNAGGGGVVRPSQNLGGSTNTMWDRSNPQDSTNSTMQSESGKSMSSTVSVAHAEAATDLVDAFTTLKKKKGFQRNTVAPIHIENMSKQQLIDLAKNLFNMVDTYSMKADEWIEGDVGLDGLNSISLAIADGPTPQVTSPAPPSSSGSSGHSGGGLQGGNGGLYTQHGASGNLSRHSSGQSLVFKRRALHEQRQGMGSAGSGESSMSIMRPPVRDTRQIKKSTDDDGYQVINEYTIIAELGRGAYGKVKLAINDSTGDSVAIKVMKKSLFKQGLSAVNKESIVAREIAIMKKLRHKNIVSLYEVINDPDADKMYLVMQYVENGVWYTLNKKDMTCTPLPHERVLNVLRQLISGLKYLHKRSIVHRDIKPDNILIGADGTPYLADFGVSEIAQSGSIHSLEGTPVFLAPEIFRGGDQSIDGIACDIWALGVTVYGALFGTPPFVGRTYEQVSKAVQFAPLHFPSDDANTPIWRDVLSRLLEKDPRHRITLRELKMHPIFDELDPAKNTKVRDECRVEVTDLDIMESIRNISGFETKKVPIKNVFMMSVKAKIIIHRFTDYIRKKVSAASLSRPAVVPAASGGGMSAIRGIGSPRVLQPKVPLGASTSRRTPPTGYRGVSTGATPPSMSRLGEVHTARDPRSTPPPIPALGGLKTKDTFALGGLVGGSGDATPRLPSLRKTVRKPTVSKQ